MRHRKSGRHLGRSSGHRRALYRNLMTELFRHEGFYGREDILAKWRELGVDLPDKPSPDHG